MIRSFKDSETEALFTGRFSRRLQQVARVAQRKLQQLHAARGSPRPGGVSGEPAGSAGGRSARTAQHPGR